MLDLYKYFFSSSDYWTLEIIPVSQDPKAPAQDPSARIGIHNSRICNANGERVRESGAAVHSAVTH